MRSLSASPTRLWPKTTDPPPPSHRQAVCARRGPLFFVPQILSDTRSPAFLLPESAVFCPPREYRLLPFSRNCRCHGTQLRQMCRHFRCIIISFTKIKHYFFLLLECCAAKIPFAQEKTTWVPCIRKNSFTPFHDINLPKPVCRRIHRHTGAFPPEMFRLSACLPPFLQCFETMFHLPVKRFLVIPSF